MAAPVGRAEVDTTTAPVLQAAIFPSIELNDELPVDWFAAVAAPEGSGSEAADTGKTVISVPPELRTVTGSGCASVTPVGCVVAFAPTYKIAPGITPAVDSAVKAVMLVALNVAPPDPAFATTSLAITLRPPARVTDQLAKRRRKLSADTQSSRRH